MMTACLAFGVFTEGESADLLIEHELLGATLIELS
jgi:hypothetical protein